MCRCIESLAPHHLSTSINDRGLRKSRKTQSVEGTVADELENPIENARQRMMLGFREDLLLSTPDMPSRRPGSSITVTSLVNSGVSDCMNGKRTREIYLEINIFNRNRILDTKAGQNGDALLNVTNSTIEGR